MSLKKLKNKRLTREGKKERQTTPIEQNFNISMHKSDDMRKGEEERT